MERGERAIFYSTHILSNISRLADELAFLIDGKVVLRTVKDDLIDRWRSISFRLAEEQATFEATVSIRTSGYDHQVVSYDREPGVVGDTGREVNRIEEEIFRGWEG